MHSFFKLFFIIIVFEVLFTHRFVTCLLPLFIPGLLSVMLPVSLSDCYPFVTYLLPVIDFLVTSLLPI